MNQTARDILSQTVFEANSPKKPEESLTYEPWMNFTIHPDGSNGEIIPLKGYNYRFVGYTKTGEVVLRVVGPTSKTIKNQELKKR